MKSTIYGEVCVASEVFLRKVKFVYDKWSFTKGEVAVIKEYRFFVFHYSCHKLGDLSTTLEMTFFLGDRHFDQVKRVEKSPKAKQWLRNEIRPWRVKSTAWMKSSIGRWNKIRLGEFCCGEKVYVFIVRLCSYHKLGDLSTSLEMTVLFFSRHFDQVKRVEKSPKAEQYLPTTLILSS